MSCAAARYLIVAGFAGVAVATLSGSDGAGLLGGILAALAVALFERFGPLRHRRSCPLPAPQDPTRP